MNMMYRFDNVNILVFLCQMALSVELKIVGEGIEGLTFTYKVNSSSEIAISGGVAPYVIQSANENVAKVDFVSNTRFTITGLSTGSTTVVVRGEDGGETSLSVAVSADPYRAFKADATTRFEIGGKVYTEFDRIFVVDKGGILLESSQQKVGFSTRDGSVYVYVGWDDDTRNPKLYTQEEVSPLSSLQFVKESEGKTWIIAEVTTPAW
jgi:hypothetical protein